MKKTLIALAVLAAAGTASAQSSVTLFGVVDATLAHGSGSVANKTALVPSGYNSSRLGFRGTEDLGGGLSASFWLEAGLNNDNGTGAATNTNNRSTGGGVFTTYARGSTLPSGAVCSATAFTPDGAAGCNVSNTTNGNQGLTFNRRSTVSLAGGWGEIRLGRDYTPQFWTMTIFDPFGTNGVGTYIGLNTGITGSTAVRASNSMGYFLPGNLGGFYGQAQYYLGELASNTANVSADDGKGYGVRLGYAGGPINVALAFSKTNNTVGGDIKQNNVGGQYDFGVAQLMGQYEWDTGPVGGVSHKGKGWLLGGLVPVGVGQIRVAYSQYKVDVTGDPTVKQWALGYVHNLSKRTALYATYAHVTDSGGQSFALNGATTSVNGSSSGYDFGLRHAF